MSGASNHYETLGVSREASAREITVGYRKLAGIVHPDKPTGNKERFQEISDAYTTLIDSKKRAAYDADLNPEPPLPPSKRYKTSSSSVNEDFVFTSEDAANFFAAAFNFDPRKEAPREKKPAPDTIIPLAVTLEQLYSGLEIPHTTPDGDKVTVKIKPGWTDGIKVTYKGLGNTPRSDIPRGDLVFIVKEEPHKRMKRDGDDLHTTIPIKLGRALAGDVFVVESIDGRRIVVKTDGLVINPKTKKKIIGEGMPNTKDPSKKGDLHVTFDVVFPESLNIEQRKTIKTLNF